MSEVKVNKISPRTACGTVTLGDSGDTFTIPSGATITNAGTASGFGATGETSWDTTVKTTGTFTATAGVGYFLNTTGGIITVNLPVGAAGSSVALADYAATWQTNNVTVAANGTEKIGGVDADVTLSTEGQSVTFVYIDGTQGWVNVLDSTSNVRGAQFLTATVSGACNTLSTSGDYKIAEFKGPGTFCVSEVGGCASNNAVDFVVVAGGASGGDGGSRAGGGGGAGGYRESPGTATSYTASPLGTSPMTSVTVTAQGYPITVGAGGTATVPSPNQGGPGSNSSFSTTTSTGGGGGGGESPSSPIKDGLAGGSGGGGGKGSGPDGCGGAGDTPPAPVAQGFAGGNGGGGADPSAAGGGGGGASAAGVVGSSCTGGAGGNGVTTQIPGSPLTLAGGGGGARGTGAAIGGSGGSGGGGAGGGYPAPAAVIGTANTGGGGGGAADDTGGATGGSGIVIIRYKFQ